MDSGASPPNDHGAPAYGIPTQSLNNENPQVNGWNGGDDSNGISENPEKLKRSEAEAEQGECPRGSRRGG
jgi:hypothetical protein